MHIIRRNEIDRRAVAYAAKRERFLKPRACLKKAFCKMCVTICGRFCPDEGAVAGYDNRIRVKYTAKWGVQIAGMIFQTGSGTSGMPIIFKQWQRAGNI